MAGEVSESESYLHGVLVTFFKRLEDDFKPDDQTNLVVTADDNLLVWSEREKQIVVVPANGVVPSLASKCQNTRPVYQKISCSHPVVFHVIAMKMSLSSHFLAIIGYNGVAVMEMPRQWGTNSLYVGGKANIICRSVLLGESLFRKQISLKVVQMEWFPGSETDSHAILLTNDNCLRCFHVGEYDTPISTISLSSGPSTLKVNPSLNFASALGEEAVSFSITPSATSLNGPSMYPIFVMQENGNVLTVWTKLDQKRIFWKTRGPLKMAPESEDNYSGDFCSILCLKTTPTVVVLATRNGIIHHCIVLEDEDVQDGDEEDRDEMRQMQRSSLCVMGMTLLVYETIELDFTLLPSEDGHLEQSETKQNFDVQLREDPTRPHCYFCTSNNGIHMVNLTWAEDLRELCLSLKENQEFECTSLSEVKFVLCTCPTEKSDPVPIIGTTVISSFDTGPLVLCLLENGELISRPVGRSNEGAIESEEMDAKISKHVESPLKRLQHAGTFDQYICNILKRENNLPVIKSRDENNKLSQAEFYALLTQATNCLREEYIQKMMKAKSEIKKRCEVLAKHKVQQLNTLEDLSEDEVLSHNAEFLAEKVSIVSENVLLLTTRLDNYIQSIQTSAPILSDAECEWGREVQQMQKRLATLKRHLQAVKQKDEDLRIGKVRHSTSKSDEQQLNRSQLVRVKTNLKEQNNRIAHLVDQVKTVDKRI